MADTSRILIKWEPRVTNQASSVTDTIDLDLDSLRLAKLFQGVKLEDLFSTAYIQKDTRLGS